MGGKIVFRLLVMLAFGYIGWRARVWVGEGILWQWALPVAGAAVGLLTAPYLTIRPVRWLHHQISRISAVVLLSALSGLLFALILSALLTIPASQLPDPYDKVMPLSFTFLLSSLAVWVIGMRGRDLWQLFGLKVPGSAESARMRVQRQSLVDTSAIIDGRIADISNAGFLQGTLLVPRPVLQELQHVADSSDPVRRARGRRGLEMLDRLQKESANPVQILDMDVEGVEDVDSKLVQLARQLNCPIVTTDFGLNRVAELQGVMVLNINKLANAVRPVLLPGEEVGVRIIQEGKEVGQGVGFLDDGTMVVVEGGRRYLNSRVDTIVTRVLQTATGRMVFAHLKNGAGRDKGDKG